MKNRLHCPTNKRVNGQTIGYNLQCNAIDEEQHIKSIIMSKR